MNPVINFKSPKTILEIFVLFIIVFLPIYFLFFNLPSKDDLIINLVYTKLKLLEPTLSFNVMENEITDSTFTINKRNIFLCIKKNGKYIDNNTLMFVAIHELSHIKNGSYGHDASFVKTFKELLKKAIYLGIYEYKNYALEPEKYCNMVINTTVI